jgi:lysophospholipase L1-like esterase
MRRRLMRPVPLAAVVLGLVAGLSPTPAAGAAVSPQVGAGFPPQASDAVAPRVGAAAGPEAGASATARVLSTAGERAAEPAKRPAPGARAEVARYAALGDSYSSGEGNPPFDPESDRPLDQCHRSPAAWPRIIARQDEQIDLVAHLACSGATSRDLRHRYNGERSQLRRLSSRPVDLVTITIGGNDIGFGQVLTDCFVSDCVVDGGLARARRRIERKLPRSLARDYRGLQAAAPGASVVVVGYPQLFPGTKARQVGCRWLSDRERIRLNRLATLLDRTIKRSARRAGVDYVSVLPALNRHELCTRDSWVYPIGPTGGQLRGHPLRPGQRALAAIVRPRLDALL